MSDIYIDAKAIVSERVKIGNNSKIWINVQIREGAVIGTDCIISKDVYIDHDVNIGNHVKIQNGVSVYNGVTIEDKVFIGPNAVFTNDYFPRAFNKEWKVTPTLVKKGASIGANATIICGNKLGCYSMIGAGSVVNRDVLDQELVVGNPIKHVGWVCECGNKLDENNHCKECGNTYNFSEK